MQPPTVAVGLFGVGLIGKALMNQIHAQTTYLREKLNVAAHVVAVSNSRRMLLSNMPLQGTDWQAALAEGPPADAEALAQHVATYANAAAGVLLDCTASDSLPQHYAHWLGDLGLHIITPNKQLGSGLLPRYQTLRQLQLSQGKHWMYEATVGAGLPVLSTLKNLLDTGDRVVSIEGILSGTLSFLFNSYKQGDAFSAVVAQAKALGYTEPDPRDDLSGADVARKVVILARECGLQVGLEDLQVSSLVPQPLQALASADEFMQQLPQFDGDMAAKAAEAASTGCVMRYVGRVDVASGAASVSVQNYASSHPFAQLSGSENMVVFITERYPAATPLVVRGPGAGAEVTAAGVFGDLLAVMRYSAQART